MRGLILGLAWNCQKGFHRRAFAAIGGFLLALTLATQGTLAASQQCYTGGYTSPDLQQY